MRVAPRAISTLAATLILAACGSSSGPAPARSDGPPPPARRGSPSGAPGDTAAAPEAGPAAGGVDLDTVRAGRFDQGKMWTFDFPPSDYLAEEYGFRPGDEWFRRARLGALRIPGCSASFVSGDGLVLTNHHCAREFVTQVSEEGENLLERGFFARSPGEERPVEDFEADQLIEIVDVTSAVERKLVNAPEHLLTERREEALEAVRDSIHEARGGEDAGLAAEAVSFYGGGRSSIYVFRRYTNARLVMAPELEIGFFGGDPDNFTYPRYNLDFAFFRLYDDDGAPLRTDDHFRWSQRGVREGDVVFVVGNPGSTSRLQSVAELLFRRDVSDRGVLAFVRRRAETIEAYARAHPAEAERYDLVNTAFSLRNQEKAMEGQLAGLADPVVLARLRDTERALLDSIAADTARSRRYDGVVEELAGIQERKRSLAPGFGAFLGLTADGIAAPTLHRGLRAYQLLNARRRAAPAAQRRELEEQLLAVGDLPPDLDEALMADRFREFVEYYGRDRDPAAAVLQGRSPEGAASAIRRGSVLSDSASTARAVADGTLSAEDPAVAAVQAYLSAYSAFQGGLADPQAREELLAQQLGRARFEVFGPALPPDATFSLRIADGVVSSYPYNGTIAPAWTTFYGLYDRYYSHRLRYADPADSPWDLPQRWLAPPAEFDLSTPVNFVSTADIIGGNSGSPVLNRELEVVGVVFDGNVESLPGEYIYLPEANRSVAVDARGILEALADVYDMDALVEELTSGRAARAGGGGD